MIRFLTIVIPVFVFSLLGLFASPCHAEEAKIDYNKKIAPLFNKYCAGCHNTEDAEGKLSMESYSDLLKGGKHGPALLAGESDSSRLIRMMTGKAKPQMPPEDNEMPSKEEIALIAAWIDAGAKGPTGKNPRMGKLVVPLVVPVKKSLKPITSVAWSATKNLIAISRYGHVELIDGLTNKPLRHISGLPGKVNSVQFNTDGSRLVTASGVTGLYGEAIIWNTTDGKKIKTFRGHKDTLYAAQLSPDGKWLATGSYDKNIILWDVQSGKEARQLKGHNGAIFDLAFSPDSKILISASADATVKVWNVSTGKRLDTRSEPLKEQYTVAFSPDGKYFFAAGADKRIRKWKLITLTSAKINPIVTARFAHEGPIIDMVFSPDAKMLTTIAEDRSLKLWDARTVSQLHVQEHLSAMPVSITFSPQSDQYAVGFGDGKFQKYPLPKNLSSSTNQQPQQTASHVLPRASEVIRLNEQEPNNSIQKATPISNDVIVSGKIDVANSKQKNDVDLYRFQSNKHEEWVIEIDAARSKSLLDSKIEILDSKGNRIQRVILRAVRDSYFTFRGKGSDISGDYRLQNWQEIGLNEYLYANGEVVKMMIYPRGPDSGFNVYPGTGKRYTYFGTSAITHALHEPCYIVEPYPVGTKLPPNGLPVFNIYYENDDDPRRELGKDSRLTFTAPETGTYFIRVTDVRSFQGEKFHYKLSLHPRRPSFKVTLTGANPKVNANSGKEIEFKAQRIDGYEGPIQIDITNVPPGFHVTTPLVIQAGHELAYGLITADANAPALTKENTKQTVITATAMINGKKITQKINNLGEIKLLKAPKVLVRLFKSNEKPTEMPAINMKPLELVIHPGETITAKVRITRNEFKGRVQFGKEFAGRNLPHGVYIDNIGLSGLTLLTGQNERTFFITADKWVPETTRTFHIVAAEDGKQTSPPVILHVRHRKTKGN